MHELAGGQIVDHGAALHLGKDGVAHLGALAVEGLGKGVERRGLFAERLENPAREHLVHRDGGEQIEGGDPGPAAVGPAGQRQRQGRVPEVEHVVGGQPRADEMHRDLPGVRQQSRQRGQPPPPPSAHHRGAVAGARRRSGLDHELPRLEHQPRAVPGHQLVPQRPRGRPGLSQTQREQQVVQVDRIELEAGRRQRRRRLHLTEGPQPSVRHGVAPLVSPRAGLQHQPRVAIRTNSADRTPQIRGREIDMRCPVGGLADLDRFARLQMQPPVRGLVRREHLEREPAVVDVHDRVER